MTDPSSRHRENAVRNEARNATRRLAVDAGAQIITRPLYTGSDLTVRDLELAARRLALDYICQAREAGHSWHDIGTTMGLTPDRRSGHTIADAAFDYAAGDPDSHYARTYGRTVGWTCTTCSKTILDHGLDNGPADDERGHAPGCTRLARTIQARDAEWEAGQ